MHMKFNEDNYFTSQPHQPFFVLAFVNAIMLMLIFMLSYKGVIHISISSVSFHTYGLVYLLFTPAFMAFLFTTYPRFTSTPAIEKKVYMQVLNFYYFGSILFILGSIVTPILSALGMIITFSGQIYALLILKNIYKSTKMEDKHDIYWIFTSMSIGVAFNFIYIVGELFYTPISSLATEASIYLYLFLLTFSIAQRMVPFFSHSMAGRNDYLMKSLFILLLLHIALESAYSNSSFIVDIFIGLLIARELKRWGIGFKNPNMLLWILHIALLWIPIAFIVGGLTNLVTLITGVTFLAIDIHMISLGFLFTILIGFGTRVTLGHSGNMMQADNITKYLFYSTQLLVVMRILVSIVTALGWNFLILFDITVTLWIILLSVWAIRFFPVLINGKKIS